MANGSARGGVKGEGDQGGEGAGRGATPPPPPDGGWGWVVVFASFMIHIVTDGMTYSFGVFYDEFLLYFGESKGKTALIVSILVGVTLCSGPISSAFVNRYGCRAVTIFGACLAGFSILVSAFAQNVITLIFTIGIGTGFGFGLIYLPAIVSVTVWFERYRSLATGIAVCGSGIGTFLFAPLIDFLNEEYGWKGTMLITSGLVLNCIAFGIMFRPVPEPDIPPSQRPMLPNSPNGRLKKSQSTEHVVRANGRANGNNDACRMTLSQPDLNKPSESRPRCGSGLMLRPDILYQGSMASLSRHRSPSPIPPKYVARSQESLDNLLKEMLDISLLTDPVFILFAVSNFLTSIGFYIPYVYLVVHAKDMGVDGTKASYCISVIGVANSIGRLVLGYISDKPWINRLVVYNACLTICGVATAAAMLCWEFYGFALYATIFGFTIGAYVGLTSVVLVDLLGLAKLTNAFGLLLLFQGIASLVGPPFAGWMYDMCKSYKPAFYVSGATIALSGLILFAVPYLQRKQRSAEDITLEDI